MATDNTLTGMSASERNIKMNQEIVPQLNETTITSRDIASLTNKEHKNVKRDIEVALEKDALKFEHIFLDSMNRKQTEYVLPKTIALGIVSGYSFELRMKIINRLEELESQNKDNSNITLLARGHVQAIVRIENLENQFDNFVSTLPVDHYQQKELLRIKSKKVYSFSPSDQKEHSVLQRKIGHKFKKQFNIPRYDALPRSLFGEAVEYLENFSIAQLAS